MNNQTTPPDEQHEPAASRSWLQRPGKVLIAIGVIAFGLVVTDRLLEAFRADDAPAKVASSTAAPLDGADQTSEATASGSMNQTLPDERESLVNLQNLFGSRVVFVSATEPGYVVTEDERRIAVGEAVNDATTLAGVTTHQLILEEAGDLQIFRLPDPLVQ